MESVVILTSTDAGELLTLQRAAYVSEARAHDDVDLPPLTQSLDELVAELSAPETSALGLRDGSGRLVAAVGTMRLFTGEHSTGNLRLYNRFGYRETHRTPTPGGYALVSLEKPVPIPITGTRD